MFTQEARHIQNLSINLQGFPKQTPQTWHPWWWFRYPAKLTTWRCTTKPSVNHGIKISTSTGFSGIAANSQSKNFPNMIFVVLWEICEARVMKGFFRQNCWLGFYYFECKWITYPIWMSLIRKGIFHDLMVFVGSTPTPQPTFQWRMKAYREPYWAGQPKVFT